MKIEFNPDGSLKMPKARSFDNLDLEKCKKIATFLFKDYSEKKGVFEKFKFPPEYNLPKGMEQGSEEQLLYLTLTVALDYIRDAEKLWEQSYKVWLNPNQKWIFNPKKVNERGLDALIDLFTKIKDQRPNKDAKIWFTICKKLLEFNGSVKELLRYLDFDAVKISKYLDSNKEDFPYLNGYKIKPLWLRIINDTVGIKLKRIEEIPLPIDVHTARMTLKLIFNENFNGEITENLRKRIQDVWKFILKDTEIYPLELDEPLWLLGKYKLLNKFLKDHNINI